MPFDRDAARDPARVRERRARRRQLRRGARRSCGEPDVARVPAVRGAHRRPPGAPTPDRLRSAARSCQHRGIHARGLARPPRRAPPGDRSRGGTRPRGARRPWRPTSAPATRRGEALSLYSLGLWAGLRSAPCSASSCSVTGASTPCGCSPPASASSPRSSGSTAEDGSARVLAAPATTARLVHPAAIGPGLVLTMTVLGFAGLGIRRLVCARARPRRSGTVFLVFSAVIVTTRIVARRVPDRLGPKRTSRVALLLLSAGLLTIGLWNVPASRLYAGTIVLALGHALAFPSLMTLAVNAAPSGERSAVVGTFTAFTDWASSSDHSASERSPRRSATTACSSSARLGRLLGLLAPFGIAEGTRMPAVEPA